MKNKGREEMLGEGIRRGGERMERKGWSEHRKGKGGKDRGRIKGKGRIKGEEMLIKGLRRREGRLIRRKGG